MAADKFTAVFRVEILSKKYSEDSKFKEAEIHVVAPSRRFYCRWIVEDVEAVQHVATKRCKCILGHMRPSPADKAPYSA